MRNLKVQPGKYIVSDVGLSDEFTVETVDDDGNDILFDFEPREWLAEWEDVVRAKLAAGASYSRVLTVCGSPFSVDFLTSAEGERCWEFTVFDITSRTDRKLTLSEREVSSLANQVRQALDR